MTPEDGKKNCSHTPNGACSFCYEQLLSIDFHYRAELGKVREEVVYLKERLEFPCTHCVDKQKSLSLCVEALKLAEAMLLGNIYEFHKMQVIREALKVVEESS